MKDYRTSHAISYEPPERMGYLSLPVLQFLWGQPWDDLALNLVHSLQPSALRVIYWGGVEKTDAIRQRVTIYLNKDDTIRSMEQEVNVGLVGQSNGHTLWVTIRERGLVLGPVEGK